MIVTWTMIAVLFAALVKVLFELGRITSEKKALEGEVDALKMQLDIAAGDIDTDTAYNGLRKEE